MKNYIYIISVLISFLVVGFFFGKGCKPGTKEKVIILPDTAAMELIRNHWLGEVETLQNKIDDLSGRKSKTLIRYRTIREKALADTVWPETGLVCDTLLMQSDSIIISQGEVIDKTRGQLLLTERVLQGCRESGLKNAVILAGVQKNYERELRRRKNIRKLCLGLLGVLAMENLLIFR